MSEGRALIVDDDTRFVELLRAALELHAIALDVTTDSDECLNLVASQRIDLVVIAVDLPEKTGFGLFSRVKGLSKVLPVVLVTATLPEREMALHQKLKVHAEDYWDKRRLTRETLTSRLSKLLPQETNPAVQEAFDEDGEDVIVVEETELTELLSDLTRVASPATLRDSASAVDVPDFQRSSLSASRPAPPAQSPVRGLSMEELESLMAELDSSPAQVPIEAPSPPSREALADSPERDEILRLRSELEESRRIARASPFSQDFFRLTESVRDKEKEIFDLKVKLEARKRELALRTGTARQLAEQLLGALRLREQEHGAVVTMEDDLQSARTDRSRAQAQLETLRERHDRQVAQLESGFAHEREKLSESCHRLESALAENEARHAEELRDELQNRLAAIEALEIRMRDEKSQAVENALDSARLEHEKQLRALQNKHHEQLQSLALDRDIERKRTSSELAEMHTSIERRLNELRREHDEHVVALETAHAQTLARKDQEREETLVARERRLNDDFDKRSRILLDRQKQELEQSNERRSAELKRALDDSRRAHLGELTELNKRLEHEKSEALRVSAIEAENRIAQLIRDHDLEISSLKDEHEGRQRALEKQTAEQASRERSQADAQRRTISELSALREQLESRIATLELKQAESLQEAEQRRLADLQNAEKRLSDEKNRARAEAASEWQKRLERSQREHSENVQALREEHERQLAAAENSHSATREKDASEISALRIELQKQQHQLQDAEAQRSTALREIEQKTRTLTALEDEWRNKLEHERQRHAESISNLRREQEAAMTSIAAQQREDLNRQKEEMAALRNESQQLREKSALLQAQHVEAQELREKLVQLQAHQTEAQKHAENEREAALQALEALLTEKHAQALSKLEDEWRRRLEAAEREKSVTLEASRRERDQESTMLQSQRNVLAKKESELMAIVAENKRLEQQLTEAKNTISSHERALEALRRESADQAQTIASLKAMIGDFSAQPLTTVPPPANQGRIQPRTAAPVTPAVPAKAAPATNPATSAPTAKPHEKGPPPSPKTTAVKTIRSSSTHPKTVSGSNRR